MSVGCLEPVFFKAFIEGFVKAVPPGFTLDGWVPTPDMQFDTGEWPKLKEYLTKGFATRGMDYWTQVFHGKIINRTLASFHIHISQGRMLVLFLF